MKPRTFRMSLVAAAVATVLLPALPQAQKEDGRLKAARELMTVSGASKQFDTVMPVMFKQMQSAFVQGHPQHQQELREIFDLVLKRFIDRKQELIEKVALIYAEHLTQQDMAAVTAFYRSPAGAKFVAAQPRIIQESMMAGQRWGQAIGAEVEAEVRKEARRRGLPI